MREISARELDLLEQPHPAVTRTPNGDLIPWGITSFDDLLPPVTRRNLGSSLCGRARGFANARLYHSDLAWISAC